MILKVTSIKKETNDVKTFTLEPVTDAQLSYKAGQFITFLFQHHKEERRSFSISSSPVCNEPLSITVKRIENGAYSRYFIDKVRVGDLLPSIGAAGLFTIPDNIDSGKQLFFFAAGIGITPIFALIKTVLHTHTSMHIVLIYSNRNQSEVVFFEELKALAETYKERFKIEFLYSDSFNLSRARLSKWLLPILLKEYSITSIEKTLFFICGPFSYMRMVIITLEELGINTNQIKKENFNALERPVVKLTPPDKDPHTVLLKYKNKQYAFIAQYPDTILQAAKKQGIVLPYSCEAGRCGSCIALCTKGSVWLSYNEVLTDNDIAKGSILTCVAYPINGNVTVEI